MESLLKNLKKHLECSICLDTYNDPKTISCLHTFCCQCLENHARASHRQGKFRCPECQVQIDLPEGNRFNSLPTSFFHNSLLSLLAVRQSGDGSSITCGNCKKKSSDVHYCFDCAIFMCPNCLTAHEVMRVAFEGHKVMPVKEFQSEDYEALLKRQPFCSQQYHEREITRFFCLPCQSCVCHACIVTDHQTHKVMLLDKAADNEKDNIMSEVEATRRNEKALKDVIRKFEETISKLETNVAIAKRGISQSAMTMITKIREREREAIDSVETTRATRLEKIKSAKEKAESLLKQLIQAAEFTENLVQRSSSSHIMQNKETLKHRFQELRDFEMPKHQETSFIKFTAAPVESLKLGDIATEGSDASQCTQTFKAGVATGSISSPFGSAVFRSPPNHGWIKQDLERFPYLGTPMPYPLPQYPLPQHLQFQAPTSSHHLRPPTLRAPFHTPHLRPQVSNSDPKSEAPYLRPFISDPPSQFPYA